VYSSWVGVIVYPGEFRVVKEEVDEAGVVHSYDELASFYRQNPTGRAGS
jgi:Mlc titration factor MtfA (ptsG expression regulator)